MICFNEMFVVLQSGLMEEVHKAEAFDRSGIVGETVIPHLPGLPLQKVLALSQSPEFLGL